MRRWEARVNENAGGIELEWEGWGESQNKEGREWGKA